LTSPDHITARRLDLRSRFDRFGVDAVLATDEPDVSWLTDFSGSHSWALLTGDRVILFTDDRYRSEAEVDCPWVEPVFRDGPMAAFVGARLQAAGVRKLAVDPEALSAMAFTQLQQSAGSAQMRAIPKLFAARRIVKDAHEVAGIRRAVAVAAAAFEATRPQLRVGMTELDVAALLEFEMRRRGADKPAFPTVVTVGERASRNHARSGNRPMTSGDAVLVDWGACVGGLHSDLTRVLFADSMPTRLRERYEIVLEAHRAALAAIVPGVSGRSVDAAARAVFERHGCRDAFTHGLGHGVGRSVHEWPILADRKEAEHPLEPGHVLAVEPGIYRPGEYGARIEDVVLVTPTGCEALCDLPRLPRAIGEH